MLQDAITYPSFSVDDLPAAERFYRETLGLRVDASGMGLRIRLANQNQVFIYPKPDHEAASFTVLNFEVPDVEAAVEHLMQQGVHFEFYNGIAQDDHGILRGKRSQLGPDIAWFKDPAGNVLAVVEQ